ncbi:hypothetical protein [Azospirillum sp. SYSU D00513]|nr:hypothetical protein [Azospirillum sp. SYSU D00513]
MAQELKSFRKDWQRWSRTERAMAVALAVLVAAILGGPISQGLF